MSKILGIIFAVLLTLGGVQPAQADEGDAPVKILIAGDGITQGRFGDYTWRYFLDKSLTDAGTAFDFVGPNSGIVASNIVNDQYIPGSQEYADANFDRDHAARWNESLFDYTNDQDALYGNDESWTRSITELIGTYHPDVIVEQAGWYDLTARDDKPAEVIGTATTFVLQAQAADPDVDIVLGQLSTTWYPRAQEYNALLPTLESLSTGTSQVVVTDIGEGVRENDTYDGTRPSPSGERKIAGAVVARLGDLGFSGASLRFAANGPQKTAKVAVSTTKDRNFATLRWATGKDATAAVVWKKTNKGKWHKVTSVSVRKYIRLRVYHKRFYHFKVQLKKGTTTSPRFSNTVVVHSVKKKHKH